MEKENVEAEGNVFVLKCQLAFNMGRLDGQLQSLRQHTIGTAFLLQRPSHGVFSTFDWDHLAKIRQHGCNQSLEIYQRY